MLNFIRFLSELKRIFRVQEIEDHNNTDTDKMTNYANLPVWILAALEALRGAEMVLAGAEARLKNRPRNIGFAMVEFAQAEHKRNEASHKLFSAIVGNNPVASVADQALHTTLSVQAGMDARRIYDETAASW